MPIEDGKLAVARAIAMTTDRVKVKKTRKRFTTSPANLFSLRFSDKKVGITDKQMPLFKSNLKRLLPTVRRYIDSIPNRASLSIREVAQLVQLGLSSEELLGEVGKRPGKWSGTRASTSLHEKLMTLRKWMLRYPVTLEGPGAGGGRRAGGKGGGSLKGSAPRSKARGPSTTHQTRRVVSTGFARQLSGGKPLGASLPLSLNEDYYFWLQVGVPVQGSIEVEPKPLPERHLPREPRLKVALFDFDEGLRITPGADVGEIQLQSDGKAIVVRQPTTPQNISRDSKIYESRLFFPVRTSGHSGEFRLRCNIYYEQILVQSRLIRARIMRRPRLIKRALSSSVDYTLSRTLSPAHVAGMEPHRLSLMLNDNGDGTHGFRFFGEKEFKNDASFDGQELQNLITLARGVLRQASWGDKNPWQKGKDYLYAGGRNLERLKADLINFAIWGYTFYDAIIDRLTGGIEQSDDLANLMRTPGLIQIALKQSARYVFPAAMIYDYGLETNAGSYTLCPKFLEALDNSGVALEDSVCFKGNCPTRDADTVVCPSGFWGYRHSLGMPLSLKSAPNAPSEITWEVKPELTVGVSTDKAFILRPQHEKALQSLRQQMGWNYAATRADVLKLLKEKDSHLVYFYCHGGMSGSVPFIQVGAATEMGITRDNLRHEKIRWKSPRPLVFINGCHTAALEPDVAMEFISAFVEVAGASGVIGTEITIFEPLAGTFAEECLRRFLNGSRIGDAIRGARLKLLKDGNPLGLVYIPYVIASLHMIEQPAHN